MSQVKKKESVMVVDRNVNVFRDWKVDTEETLAEMLANDFKYWKINRIVKDQAELKHIE